MGGKTMTTSHDDSESGKSCRLRWVNYLRPGLKKAQLTPREEEMIIELHAILGNKWSTIAKYLPGRTDNEIKNYWRTHSGKRERSKHNKKLQRPKVKNVLKQLKQKQQHEQQPQEYDIKSSMSHEETENETKSFHTQNNNQQEILEMGFMYPTTIEHQYTVPSMHDGFSSTWQDTLADDGSWFSLWDFDEPQGFSDYVDQFGKCAMPNQASFGAGGDYSMQNHVKTSCFVDTYDSLFYGKDMWSTIAKYLPGRTDNDIKNYWRTHFEKSGKSKHKKLEMQKAKVLKQLKQKQQPQEYDVKSIKSHEETKNETKSYETENNKQKEVDFMCPTMEHQYIVPSMHEGFSSTWPDTVLGDDGSWFSLWDFDDEPQCSADYVNQFSESVVPNQATFGVGEDSMQNHDKIFYFDDI
ncbi:hypothetical protein JHK87_051477 [Glycine soja]|nr:hypothetical protein JHK87_051477 [Glycine soja]